MRFTGDPGMYRYWDATKCVEFGYRMAEQALEVELKEETAFLARYDKIVKAVGEQFDVRGNILRTLVLCCLDNNGTISNRRRKQYEAAIPKGLIEFIEHLSRMDQQDSDSLEIGRRWRTKKLTSL